MHRKERPLVRGRELSPEKGKLYALPGGWSSNMLSHGVCQSFSAGEFIYSSTADRTMHARLIINGRVFCERTLLDGRSTILDLYGPGELIGLDVDGRLQEVARAQCDIPDLLLIDCDSPLSPDDAKQFHFEVSRQLGYMTRRAIINTLYKVDERLRLILVDLVERFGTHDPRTTGVINLDIGILQSELALMIGARPETVCRVINQLERQGIIATHGRRVITILDIERLKQPSSRSL